MAEQKKKPVSVWEQALRRTLKAEHGKGWSLRESRGRAQLVQILEDRSRRSTKLDVVWTSKNARLMLEAVAQLREYLDGGMDWDRAVAARAELTVHSTGTTKATKQVDWGAACDRFFESRSNRLIGMSLVWHKKRRLWLGGVWVPHSRTTRHLFNAAQRLDPLASR